MTEQALRKMIATGESTRQEFKSWVKCKDYRQRKELAVKSAVALANTKGGVLLFGVEDDGTITVCPQSTQTELPFEAKNGRLIFTLDFANSELPVMLFRLVPQTTVL
mgnify:CR=1 FL=1